MNRPRLHRAGVTFVAALSLSTLLFTSCSSTPTNPGPEAGADRAPATCPNGKIRFGIEPFEDPGKLTPAAQVLGEALSKKLNCPVEVQVVETYAAEVLAMQNGQLEIGMFGPLGYVFASQRAQAEPVVSFGDGTGELSTYKAGIWVPNDSPIQSVVDLKGTSLALGSNGSTSGDALPRFAVRKAGLSESDLKIQYAGGHPQALLALTNGKVDAAEINTQQQAVATESGTFDPSKFRQIWASDPIPNDPITVAGALDPELKNAITTGLTTLDPEDVAKVGALLDVEPGPLVPVSKDTYQALFDLAETLGLTEKDVS